MRLSASLLTATTWALLSTTHAAADACHDEIAAMFDGGPIDAYSLPPYSHVIETFDAAGATTYVMEGRVETPVRQVGTVRGSGIFTLMIGNDTWSGPTIDGPWTAGVSMGLTDPEAAHRTMKESMIRNLSEAECLGPVTVDGRSLVEYRYFTAVDPDPARADSWWKNRYRWLIDPATSLPVLMEQTEMEASWAPGTISTDRTVTTFTFVPGLVVAPPQP